MAKSSFERCPGCHRTVWLQQGYVCCQCREEANFVARLCSDPRGLALELKAKNDALETTVDHLQDALDDMND